MKNKDVKERDWTNEEKALMNIEYCIRNNIWDDSLIESSFITLWEYLKKQGDLQFYNRK